MARLRWFIAGAAAATGALVAAPSAYTRLRGLVDHDALPAPEPPLELAETVAEADNGSVKVATPPAPAAAFATYDRDADELREKIENTRGRIREKAAPPVDEDDEVTQ
jgi:ABC-type amino acid transport substrate-binding protein